MPKQSPTEDLSPFAAPALLVLTTLADGPKHGYVIMQEAERLSGQPLGPGTLYAALARLGTPRSHRGRPIR